MGLAVWGVWGALNWGETSMDELFHSVWMPSCSTHDVPCRAVYILGGLGSLCCECIKSPNWVLVQLVVCAANSQLCLLILMPLDMRGCINLAFFFFFYFCAWWKNTQWRREMALMMLILKLQSWSKSRYKLFSVLFNLDGEAAAGRAFYPETKISLTSWAWILGCKHKEHYMMPSCVFFEKNHHCVPSKMGKF